MIVFWLLTPSVSAQRGTSIFRACSRLSPCQISRAQHEWIITTIKPKVKKNCMVPLQLPYILQKFYHNKRRIFQNSLPYHRSGPLKKVAPCRSSLTKVGVHNVIHDCKNLQSRPLGYLPEAKRSHQLPWEEESHMQAAWCLFVVRKVNNGKSALHWKWAACFETLHTYVLNMVLHVAAICSCIFRTCKTFLCTPCPPPSRHQPHYLAVKESGHLFTRSNFSATRILGRRRNIT
jgi:hypothetical protein